MIDRLVYNCGCRWRRPMTRRPGTRCTPAPRRAPSGSSSPSSTTSTQPYRCSPRVWVTIPPSCTPGTPSTTSPFQSSWIASSSETQRRYRVFAKKDLKRSLKSEWLLWTYEKTSHTTWTFSIKIWIICLYIIYNKIKVQVVWLVFSQVRSNYSDLRDFFRSF